MCERYVSFSSLYINKSCKSHKHHANLPRLLLRSRGLDSDSNSFLTSRVPKGSQCPVSCKRSLVLTGSIVVRFLEGVPALPVLDLQRYDCNGTASDSLRCHWGGQVWMVTPYLCRGDLRSRPARSLVYFRPQGRAHSAVSSEPSAVRTQDRRDVAPL